MLPSIYGDASVAVGRFCPYIETLPSIYGDTSVAVGRFHPYMETLPPKKEIGHILAAEHAVRDASRDDSVGNIDPLCGEGDY